ncbi:hypothetical protein DD236_07525 [Ancrocorticia populi]|uniref:Uncharacterized protein n=1 Tax=Ancrocorticia populi TaxID=2175228 RepID=A0A2V1K4D6_9ACTO|nr:hypothetical protein DD236_07525 [Ancrocorticia populi]
MAAALADSRAARSKPGLVRRRARNRSDPITRAPRSCAGAKQLPETNGYGRSKPGANKMRRGGRGGAARIRSRYAVVNARRRANLDRVSHVKDNRGKINGDRPS